MSGYVWIRESTRYGNPALPILGNHSDVNVHVATTMLIPLPMHIDSTLHGPANLGINIVCINCGGNGTNTSPVFLASGSVIVLQGHFSTVTVMMQNAQYHTQRVLQMGNSTYTVPPFHSSPESTTVNHLVFSDCSIHTNHTLCIGCTNSMTMERVNLNVFAVGCTEVCP